MQKISFCRDLLNCESGRQKHRFLIAWPAKNATKNIIFWKVPKNQNKQKIKKSCLRQFAPKKSQKWSQVYITTYDKTLKKKVTFLSPPPAWWPPGLIVEVLADVVHSNFRLSIRTWYQHWWWRRWRRND